MKLLVFSDSHRSTLQMIDAIETEQPDTIIHLGDLLSDTNELRHIYPNIPLIAVPGNCDGWTDEPEIKLITIMGKKILLSHGHKWRVKQGYDVAQYTARKSDADILLFGHTHIPYCVQDDDLWVLNPGAAPNGYGRITINGDDIFCELTNSDKALGYV